MFVYAQCSIRTSTQLWLSILLKDINCGNVSRSIAQVGLEPTLCLSETPELQSGDFNRSAMTSWFSCVIKIYIKTLLLSRGTQVWPLLDVLENQIVNLCTKQWTIQQVLWHSCTLSFFAIASTFKQHEALKSVTFPCRATLSDKIQPTKGLA